MELIPPGDDLTHFTKTLTFTGASTLGQQNTNATVATRTGRVLVEHIIAYCTTSLTGASSEISLGTASVPEEFVAKTIVTGIDQDQWWMVGGAPDVGIAGSQTEALSVSASKGKAFAVSEDIIIRSEEANTTGGVLVIDVWYRPITSDGALT